MTEKEKPKKRVIDIAHPGSSAPDETSRSIIVNNRPIVQDPMMVDRSSKTVPDPEITADKEEPKTGAIKLQPLPEEDATTKDTVEVKADEVAAEAPAESQPEQSIAKTEEAAIEQTADTENAEEIKEDTQDAEIQKLVDSKQYYLPINAVERRRTHRFVVFGLVLCVLLGLAWLNVALDAGLIELGGLKAVTNFF